MTPDSPSEKTRVRRLPMRGAYDAATIRRILDEGFVCHVGFVANGQPFVIPMAYARDGDRLLLHGSAGSRMMRSLARGVEVCVTVTLVDGLVLARSAFHHSMNYRSVVVFGAARAVEDDANKLDALRRFFDHIAPGRWDEVRPPNEKEMAQTLVLEIPIDEASAKSRTGPVSDEEEDYALDVWAGILPFEVTPSPPVADERLAPGIEVPDYLSRYTRKGGE